MRKLSAIFFFSVLLFSTGGYHLLISQLEQRADRRLESLLDDEVYEESALIEVQMPLNMPYQQRYTGYERHYGNVEINGTTYTYVKKKIEGDVVIFKCIPNIPRQQLKDMRFDLTRANAGLAGTTDEQNQKHRVVLKYSLDDFDDQLLNALPLSTASIRSLQYGYVHTELTSCVSQVPHAPPEC